MLKKITTFIIMLLLIYNMSEFIIRKTYYILVRLDYIFLGLPFIHLTKYFIISTMCIIVFKRGAELTEVGRIIVPLLLILSIVGILVTTLSVNIITNEKITNYRTVWFNSYSWNEVDYVQTESRTKKSNNRLTNTRSYKKSKVNEKYVIHYKNGNKINVWDNIHTNNDLHHFIVNKKININYIEAQNTFDLNYKGYFKKDINLAKFIFLGIESK